MKSRLVFTEINHSHGRMQTEMFAPTPSTLSLKTMLATISHDRNNHPEDDRVAIAIDVHTAFLHADIDQDLYAEPPEESELNEDEVWKNPNFHSLERPELFQKRRREHQHFHLC